MLMKMYNNRKTSLYLKSLVFSELPGCEEYERPLHIRIVERLAAACPPHTQAPPVPASYVA